MKGLPPPLAWPAVVPFEMAERQCAAAHRALDRWFQEQPQPQNPEVQQAALQAALEAKDQANTLEYYMRLDVPGGQ